ncbi:MAG: hypothetical protein INR72_19150, partial [Williamsia herbipolensis]|nr:hypothetical protein [Williamsia herbipolensis]
LLAVILAVHFEGRSLWFSPAVAAATVGGVLALLATRLPAHTPRGT